MAKPALSLYVWDKAGTLVRLWLSDSLYPEDFYVGLNVPTTKTTKVQCQYLSQLLIVLVAQFSLLGDYHATKNSYHR